MKVFIDFDDVIFNTKKFKDNFRNMFIEHGVSGEFFDKYYNDPLDTRAIKTFDPWRQIAQINRELGIDTKYLTDLVNEYISDMSAYVFPDVIDFVNLSGSENIHVVSFGEHDFQTKKVKNSGIGSYITNIIVTEDSKAKEIGEILEKENIAETDVIFFLDDRIEQIQEVKKKFPNMVTILIKRPEGRYQEMQKEACCDFEAHNLIEAGKIIRGIIEVRK